MEETKTQETHRQKKHRLREEAQQAKRDQFVLDKKVTMRELLTVQKQTHSCMNEIRSIVESFRDIVYLCAKNGHITYKELAEVTSERQSVLQQQAEINSRDISNDEKIQAARASGMSEQNIQMFQIGLDAIEKSNADKVQELEQEYGGQTRKETTPEG